MIEFAMIELRSESVADTRAIAAAIAGLARLGDLIVLAGQMGAGKTAFAQGFARSLGVLEPVTSPTYTLVHTYPAMAGPATATGPNTNTITLHHADLYRLERVAEVDDLALPELLEDDAVMLVEWGDKVDLGPQLQVELRLAAGDLIGDGLIGDGRIDFEGPDDPIDDLIDVMDDGGATDTREITITSSDRRWDLRWERLALALQRWAG